MTQQTSAAPTGTSHGRLVGIVAVLLALAAMHVARPVLLPLVTGLLIAALSWPLNHWLSERIPRGLALLTTVLVVTIAILALFGAVGWGAASVVNRLREQPERLGALHERVNSATQRFGVTVPDFGVSTLVDPRSNSGAGPDTSTGTITGGSASAANAHASGGSGAADSASAGGAQRTALAKRFGFGAYSTFGYLGLAVGFAALALAELRITREKMVLRFGERQGGKVLAIGAELAHAMRRYVKVKSITSLIAGVSTAAISLIFGIEFAAL